MIAWHVFTGRNGTEEEEETATVGWLDEELQFG